MARVCAADEYGFDDRAGCGRGCGGSEAVDASQMGKLAAPGIHVNLSGEAVTFAGAK